MKAFVTFDTSMKDEVEAHIKPPMGLAVTIPLIVTDEDGKRIDKGGIALYIATSDFMHVTEANFKKIVEGVVEQLEAREG